MTVSCEPRRIVTFLNADFRKFSSNITVSMPFGTQTLTHHVFQGDRIKDVSFFP